MEGRRPLHDTVVNVVAAGGNLSWSWAGRLELAGSCRPGGPDQTIRSDRETGAAAAGCGGIGIDHAERGADQVVDEIDLGPRQKKHRGGIDQHHGAVTRDHQVILSFCAVDVEFVLKAGAAAALDAYAQHCPVTLALEDFPDAAGRPLADGNIGCCHDVAPIADTYLKYLVSGAQHS